jgi:hypothetical protein
MQTVTGVIVVFFSCVLHAAAQPYNMAILNQSESAALVTAFLTLQGGLYLQTLDGETNVRDCFKSWSLSCRLKSG